jgi:hypothetical protein
VYSTTPAISTGRLTPAANSENPPHTRAGPIIRLVRRRHRRVITVIGTSAIMQMTALRHINAANTPGPKSASRMANGSAPDCWAYTSVVRPTTTQIKKN